MKVLHVAWSLRFGGIEKLLFDLLRYQKSQADLQADLLVGKKQGEFVNLFKNEGLKVYDLGLKSGLDLRLSKFRKAKTLMQEYDIVHFHSFTPIFAWAAKKSKKKIFYTIHGGFGFGRKRRLNDSILEYLKKCFLQNEVDFISCNSAFTLRVAKSRLNLKDKTKYDIIFNGIDIKEKLESSERGELEIELVERFKSKFIIGTVSRFAGFKRIDRLIRAFAKMDNRFDSQLVLVGDGPLKSELEKLVDELAIRELVTFTGYKENVSLYQKAMDICVYPSQNEPFGLVAVESLALGKKVLVFSDGGGLVEVVGNISSDLIVDSEEELTNKLDVIFQNKNKVELENQIIKKYAKQFSIEKMGKTIYQTYNSITS